MLLMLMTGEPKKLLRYIIDEDEVPTTLNI